MFQCVLNKMMVIIKSNKMTEREIDVLQFILSTNQNAPFILSTNQNAPSILSTNQNLALTKTSVGTLLQRLACQFRNAFVVVSKICVRAFSMRANKLVIRNG